MYEWLERPAFATPCSTDSNRPNRSKHFNCWGLRGYVLPKKVGNHCVTQARVGVGKHCCAWLQNLNISVEV